MHIRIRFRPRTPHFAFFLSVALVFVGLLAVSVPGMAQEAGSKVVAALPEPDKTGGKPLMQALAERHSTRSFTDEALSEQDLSNLLWAAWGVNRADGRHTAPTAKNKQNVAVYVAKADGVWRYIPEKQAIEQYMTQDIRGALGAAPVILLYAAPQDDDHAGFHIGSLYQNAALYCASAGLGCVVKATGADEADRSLALKDGYKVMIIQAVGHGKE